MTLHQWLMLVSAFPLLCLSVSCVIWVMKRASFSWPLQILGYFLLFNLFIEIGARLIVYFVPNNLPLLHLYTVGEFVLLSFFYRSLLPEHVIFRKFFPVLLVMVSLLILMNTLFLQSIFVFNSYAKTLVQIILILYAILFFFHLPEASSFKTQEGWSLRMINSAVLIYYCGSLFIFMFSNIFIEKSIIYHGFWIFNALLNFLFHILVLIGLWRVAFRRPKLSF
ncbi:MAG: hypothetical protein ACKV1O_03090 [Saprospiraceae bacterium]